MEHIVQDGSSADGTIQVLEEFGDRVRWRSEPDDGQSDALNKALSLADHEWVGWLNADEFYLPGGLEMLAEAGEGEGADVVYGDCVFVDERGRVLQLLAAHRFDATVLRRYGCFIKSCSTLFRRASLPIRPWDQRLRMTMDWELFLRLEAGGARFQYVPFPVGAFRVHSSRVTAEPRGSFVEEYALLRQKYGAAGRGRRIGRSLHQFHKLVEGGYGREVRARRLSGSDIRWFDPEVGVTAWEALFRRCYGASFSSIAPRGSLP